MLGVAACQTGGSFSSIFEVNLVRRSLPPGLGTETQSRVSGLGGIPVRTLRPGCESGGA